MRIRVNGEALPIDQPCSVKDLLDRRGLGSVACAVEVNRTLIPRQRHDQVVLAEGDMVEIVTLVGGG
jgi:thiamine biosynthesis protein ThiS